jgi:hypothetical protein
MSARELDDVFAAAVALLSAVWPVVSGDKGASTREIRAVCAKYPPHIRSLEIVFGQTVRSLEYTGEVGGRLSSTAALGRPISSNTLSPSDADITRYFLERDDPFQSEDIASLSHAILAQADTSTPSARQVVTSLEADAHHIQSLAALNTNSGTAMDHASPGWCSFAFDSANGS